MNIYYLNRLRIIYLLLSVSIMISWTPLFEILIVVRKNTG